MAVAPAEKSVGVFFVPFIFSLDKQIWQLYTLK